MILVLSCDLTTNNKLMDVQSLHSISVTSEYFANLIVLNFVLKTIQKI